MQVGAAPACGWTGLRDGMAAGRSPGAERALPMTRDEAIDLATGHATEFVDQLVRLGVLHVAPPDDSERAFDRVLQKCGLGTYRAAIKDEMSKVGIKVARCGTPS